MNAGIGVVCLTDESLITPSFHGTCSKLGMWDRMHFDPFDMAIHVFTIVEIGGRFDFEVFEL